MSEQRKVALVTGSTHGVGRIVALALAKEGFDLVLHGRDEAAGRRLVEEVGQFGISATFHRADFASLQAVRDFAGQISGEHRQLHLLINNAGIGFGAPGSPREVSADDFELRFAVNYLAPFLLTHLLEPLLVAASPSRIVNVASAGQAPLDLDDLMLEHGYDGTLAYRRSKLALIMFTVDLADELRKRGVTANCLHPATFMDTGMVHEAHIKPQTSVEQGAEAILHLAVGKDVDGVTGAYFDGMRRSHPASQAYDENARRRLREMTLRLTGLAHKACESADRQDMLHAD